MDFARRQLVRHVVRSRRVPMERTRAIRSYEKAGFARGDVYVRTFDDGNEVTFLRMSRLA